MSSTISVSKKRKSSLDTTASYSVNNAKKNKMSKLSKSPGDKLHVIHEKKKERVQETETTSEESTVEESEDEVADTQDTEADELITVKQELSNMSFEELIQLKERLGLKVYNQVVHGDKVKKPTSKRVFKRENKNRPMEMSSKRPVRLSKESDPAKKKMTRDPRFDDLSGEYNESYFKSNYSFLFDIKSREKEKIKKTLKKEKDPEKKVELKMLYNRMDQQEQSEIQKDKRKTLEKEWKKKEQSQVQQGKKPFFLKKADLRKLELAEKYKELQKSGKLEKYLSKKRKKTAQKEKKKLPLMS